MKLFKIDRRVGCIAIIDTRILPPSNGLHKRDPHVIWYRRGFWLPNMTAYTYDNEPAVLASAWHIPKFRIKMAKRLCDKMNNKFNKKEKTNVN